MRMSMQAFGVLPRPPARVRDTRPVRGNDAIDDSERDGWPAQPTAISESADHPAVAAPERSRGMLGTPRQMHGTMFD